MSVPPSREIHCSVARGELLPAGSGGAEALCAEIKTAAAELRLAQPSVVVEVVSPYMLAARVSVGGRSLPEMKMARSDQALDRAAFRRFAQAIAASMAAHQS